MHIISNFLVLIIINFLFVKEYGIFQSYHYELNRYLYHLKKNKGYGIYLYCLLFIFIIRSDVLFILFAMPLLVFLIRKHPIKYTNRVKRIMGLNLSFLTIALVFDLIKYIYIFCFFYLCFLHFISCIIEEVIFIRYLKSARIKIKDKFIIGVTGSGGKTSIKNMIYDVLSNGFNVSKTPKSFNNRVGIVKAINEDVKDYDDYFICEYGVDRVRGMDKLLKVVKPDIAVVSYIGNQHLLTFKNKENILREKMKLVEALTSRGCAIINNDDDLLRNYNYRNKRVIRYGIKHDADVVGKNLILDVSHSEFDLYIKGKKIKHVNAGVLSIHSVENILATVGVLLALNLDLEFIVGFIESVSPLSHRLEPKVIEGISVIDDSFNSNEKGFKNAIDLLITSDKYKIVITPGIIEQGLNNELLNKRLASYLIRCDFVCLVSDNSKSIKEEFDFLEYKNYKLFGKFIDAFEYVKRIDKEKIVLIENDLPDIYLN